MDDKEELVTEERKQKDILITKAVNRQKRLIINSYEESINKLPNEFRHTIVNWNPYSEDY